MGKIDFVILWVDGNDESWIRQKRQYYNNELNQNKASVYRDWGILKYWFRGVEKYTPWVNKIHFVTYGHLPKWLDINHPKIHIVKHEDIISKEYLPTFSANSIELNIHKIEGLSEKFVYFNDDTFIINSMKEEDFFDKGLPCDSAIMSATIPSVKNEIFTYILFNDLLYINANFDKKDLKGHLGKWLNYKYGKAVLKNLYYLPLAKFTGFENLHLPNSYLKSVWNEVWEKEPEILNQTISHRFRTKEDVNQYIFKYWQLVTGKFVPRYRSIGKCFVIGEDDLKISNAILKQQYKMICLNDNPCDDIEFAILKQKIDAYFSEILPEKSMFEK